MIGGIDLAGPTNHKDTSMAFINDNVVSIKSGLSDSDIYELISINKVEHIGIDAPLSYSESGGYRRSDSELRKMLNRNGFSGIGVMAPTYSRMIYLTSRGIRLTRLLSFLDNTPRIYEVHPGAFYVLDNYPYQLVKSIKKSNASLIEICRNIENRGYQFERMPDSDHELMAVGVALAVEGKLKGKAHWEYSSDTTDGYSLLV